MACQIGIKPVLHMKRPYANTESLNWSQTFIDRNKVSNLLKINTIISLIMMLKKKHPRIPWAGDARMMKTGWTIGRWTTRLG